MKIIIGFTVLKEKNKPEIRKGIECARPFKYALSLSLVNKYWENETDKSIIIPIRTGLKIKTKGIEKKGTKETGSLKRLIK